MTFLLSLFLSVAKRRDDVIIYAENKEKTRLVVNSYNENFINTIMGIMSSVIIVCYLMYTMSYNVLQRLGPKNHLYLTVIFVIYGIFRYFQIILVENKSSSPMELILSDRVMQLNIFCWVALFAIIIYF
jgi:predicted neutral ceramidase superfamily lipid hydrolase